MSIYAWNQIEWQLIEFRISRLQNRIYKAMLRNNLKTVHFLQRKLTSSVDGKLLSVREVTTHNRFNDTNELYKYKLYLAKSLELDVSTSFEKEFLKQKKKSERLKMTLIKDQAKQYLVKLALEPQWKALLKAGSSNFDYEKRSKDIIEEIYNKIQNKSVSTLTTILSFERLNPVLFTQKINTIRSIAKQVEVWLQRGLLNNSIQESEEFFKSSCKHEEKIIFPLLASITLHGLEIYLRKWSINLEISSKNYETYTRMQIIKYKNNFLIASLWSELIEKSPLVLNHWLSMLGLKLHQERTSIKKVAEGFDFLGFHIILITWQKYYRLKIHVSKNAKVIFLQTIRETLKKSKAVSTYKLIQKLKPILIKWANYYVHCECSKDFRQIDHVICDQLKRWVFRRKASGKNKFKLKELYFPTNKIWVYKKIVHKNNWVLASREDKPNIYLPKLSWIKSFHSFSKVN
jgi:RNA-directed DNA polymerase